MLENKEHKISALNSGTLIITANWPHRILLRGDLDHLSACQNLGTRSAATKEVDAEAEGHEDLKHSNSLDILSYVNFRLEGVFHYVCCLAHDIVCYARIEYRTLFGLRGTRPVVS